jgi:hypothetical protein
VVVRTWTVLNEIDFKRSNELPITRGTEQGRVMTDSRKPSPSDELLDRARGNASSDDSDPGGFVPSSPADAYSTEGFGDWATSGVEPGDVALDGGVLSAEDIAAELIEARQLSASASREEPPADVPVDQDAVDSVPDASTSLPDWAIGESAPPPLVVPETALPSEDPPPSSETVAVSAGEVSVAASAALDEGDTVVQDRWTTPSSEWEAYEAEKAARKANRLDIPVPRFSLPVSGRVVGALIGLAIFGISFLVNHFDGKEAVADAAVGDCFIVGAELEIDQVPVVDCSKKHDSELFARVSMVELGAVYPNEDLAFDWLFDECVDRFPSYVGEPYETSAYWIDMLIPTADGWADGDHTGLCTIVVMDGDFNAQMTTGSARSSANKA